MNTIVEAGLTIALAIIGLGLAATLVSKNAQTSNIIQSAASGLGNDIAVAQSPVTGTSVPINLGYPSSNSLINGFGS